MAMTCLSSSPRNAGRTRTMVTILALTTSLSLSFYYIVISYLIPACSYWEGEYSSNSQTHFRVQDWPTTTKF
jgi:hypothetical protein